jgi:hypothetical protein
MKNKQNFTGAISYPDGGRGERSRAQQGKVRRARAKLAPRLKDFSKEGRPKALIETA